MDSEHIKQAIKTNKIKYRKYKDINNHTIYMTLNGIIVGQLL